MIFTAAYQINFIIPLILSAVLGGILGYQRLHWGKAAGVRTYALVSVGSCLFTLLSTHAFSLTDTARVAAGIVTGIGFLGAGTILRREDRVEGLTTAAGLWLVAAVGMACGVSFYLLATASTLIALFLLIIGDKRIMKTNGEYEECLEECEKTKKNKKIK